MYRIHYVENDENIILKLSAYFITFLPRVEFDFLFKC